MTNPEVIERNSAVDSRMKGGPTPGPRRLRRTNDKTSLLVSVDFRSARSMVT